MLPSLNFSLFFPPRARFPVPTSPLLSSSASLSQLSRTTTNFFLSYNPPSFCYSLQPLSKMPKPSLGPPTALGACIPPYASQTEYLHYPPSFASSLPLTHSPRSNYATLITVHCSLPTTASPRTQVPLPLLPLSLSCTLQPLRLELPHLSSRTYLAALSQRRNSLDSLSASGLSLMPPPRSPSHPGAPPHFTFVSKTPPVHLPDLSRIASCVPPSPQ